MSPFFEKYPQLSDDCVSKFASLVRARDHTCDIFFLHGREISSLKIVIFATHREVYYFVVMTDITSSNCTGG